MIGLHKITIQGFRSFRDPQTIELPATGFVLVDGQNFDTGGSSGSGKSSVVEAVAYALGYCKLPATELQCRNATAAPLQVQLTLNHTHLGQIEIARGKHTYVEYPDKPKITGARLVAEEINKILGLPLDLVEALTYRPQRSFGRFISMGDIEKKEFLTNCLPELSVLDLVGQAAKTQAQAIEDQLGASQLAIEHFEAEIQRLKDNRPDHTHVNTDDLSGQIEATQARLGTLTARMTQAETELQTTKNGIAAKKAAARATIEADLVAATANLDAEAMSLKNQLTEHQAGLKALGDQLAQAEETNRKAVQDLSTEIAGLRKTRVELLQAYATKPDVETQIAALIKEIADLENNICPTCQRTWLEQGVKLQELQARLQSLSTRIPILNEIGNRAQALETKIATLEANVTQLHCDPKIQELRATIQAAAKPVAETQAALSGINARKQQIIAMVDDKLRSACVSLDLEAQEALRTHEAAQADLRAHNAERQALEARLADAVAHNKSIVEQAEKYRQIIVNVEGLHQAEVATTQPLRDSLAVETAVALALGRSGYLGAIFDEILAEISTEITDVLANIPNVSSVSLRFSSEVTTAKGTVKKTIQPVVTKDGIEASFKSLSGGQQAAVELAVDLAIGNVIGRRTGRTPGWIVLDEAFDGLDTPAKEACLAILKRYADGRLVIVIDHTSEIKELFDRHVVVQMVSGVSRVL